MKTDDERTDPGISTSELLARYGLGNYGRLPLAIVRGQGSALWDERGDRYLDFGTGIAVCSIGHSHPRMVRAIEEQSRKLIHCSNLYEIREQGLLARRLVETVVGLPGRVFFCNSGAEANEAMIKLARRFGHASPGSAGPRTDVITLSSSFHGRTLAGIAATGQAKVKEGFAPIMPGFVHVAHNELDAVEAAITPKTAAILLEAIQGEGGIHVAEAAFLKGLAALCRERNLLLMFDEVQCGIGRAGSWCGWKAVLGEDGQDVEPDAVSWAKGLGGGYPLGGMWVKSRAIMGGTPEKKNLCELLGPGSHGSTYGGGPLASVVGLAVLAEIEESGLCEAAAISGTRVRETITAWQLGIVQEVRGLGLMLGVVLDSEKMKASIDFEAQAAAPSLYIGKKLMEAGLLVVPAGPNVVRLLPPLNISEDEIEEGLTILRAVLEGIERNVLEGQS